MSYSRKFDSLSDSSDLPSVRLTVSLNDGLDLRLAQEASSKSNFNQMTYVLGMNTTVDHIDCRAISAVQRDGESVVRRPDGRRGRHPSPAMSKGTRLCTYWTRIQPDWTLMDCNGAILAPLDSDRQAYADGTYLGWNDKSDHLYECITDPTRRYASRISRMNRPQADWSSSL